MVTVSRRALFAALAFTAFGGWCFARARRDSDKAPSTPQTMDPEELLRKDLVRLSSRVYSEEGIPMILACENLVGGPQPSAIPTPLNYSLASAFRRDAEIWQRLHPDAAPNDIAKILELLADRDFAAGGTETTL